MDETPCYCILCAPPSDGLAYEVRDSRIAKSVKDFGWHVMGVWGGDEAPADWAYSIGLWHTLRSPEICVFGLSAQTGMKVANAAGYGIRDGLPLEPNQRRDDVLDGVGVVVRPVHPSWYKAFFGAGLDFHRRPPWPVTQLFWPDKAGRFPWEDEADEYCRASQPLLWLPKDQTEGPWSRVA